MESSHTPLVGVQMGTVTLENCFLLSIKAKLMHTPDPVIPLLGLNSTEIRTYVKICVQECLLHIIFNG